MPYDVTHFDNLGRLLELERAEEESRHRALVDGTSDAELVRLGLRLTELEAHEESVGFGGRVIITFQRAGNAELGDGFDPGAVVEVAPKRSETALAWKAIVARRRSGSIALAFDEPPGEEIWNGRMTLTILPNDVTHRRAKAALAEVRGMEKGAARRRRDVLLGEAEPRTTTPDARPLERPLNAEQTLAVHGCLAADDVFLVHGPPGTGKSTVLAEVAVQAVRRGRRVLATAASNSAVDHLVSICAAQGLDVVRIGHPARVAERLHPHVLDVRLEEHPDVIVARDLFEQALAAKGYARRQRQRGRSQDRFANAREASAAAAGMFKDARLLERRAAKAILDDADVICATLTALGGSELADERFDLALLDEATQAIEPLSLLAFLKADRLVLAGDHKQLGPTVLSQKAAREGLATSLFVRLLEVHGDPVKVMLREQYRMHEAIMAYPSSAMYGGELRAHASVAQRRLAELLEKPDGFDDAPLVFIDTAGKGFDEERPEGSESLANPGEADLVATYVRCVMERGLPAEAISVIAPYSAQVAALKARIEGVGIDTVDAFQGRENELVVVSLTRGNAEGVIGFLADINRMNVAMTRAKRQLVVVGDSGTISGHPFYAGFIEHTQATGAYRSAWELEIA
ncbi:MAG TPA: AAA domain-containing protein [Myxococcota bacterium]|nr:AAA domain-containing protein [Myxococcota bacterium]